MTEGVEQEFVVLKFDNRYEISTTEPWNIRRIGQQNCKQQSVSNSGYLHLHLGAENNTQLVHRLVANQFIDNDDPNTKTQVDHINRNKLDNSIKNLRWVTPKENYANSNRPKNLQPNEYLDKLPADAELIEEYNGYEFDRYYYDLWNERILMETKSGRIKVINPYQDGPQLRIQLLDINDKKCKFGYNKLIDYFKHNY